LSGQTLFPKFFFDRTDTFSEVLGFFVGRAKMGVGPSKPVSVSALLHEEVLSGTADHT
jgi:hypothetical protein